jgi:hypothetical protein
MLSATRRYLPRGWAHLAWQFAIWFGFLAVYQLARGLAGRNPARAFTNGWRIVHVETRITHRLYELTFQQFVDQRVWLAKLVSWTYWNSEFTVLGIALLWVYFRRHDTFFGFRNSVLLANVLGLFGYVFMPTAPPRLLGLGFVNGHSDGLVTLAANPYAAMPSLHAADSLIVGVFLATVTRHWWAKAFWIAWPAWVWFAVMATGNHFWLDCVAGMGVAVLAMVIVRRYEVDRDVRVRLA